MTAPQHECHSIVFRSPQQAALLGCPALAGSAKTMRRGGSGVLTSRPETAAEHERRSVAARRDGRGKSRNARRPSGAPSGGPVRTAAHRVEYMPGWLMLARGRKGVGPPRLSTRALSPRPAEACTSRGGSEGIGSLALLNLRDSHDGQCKGATKLCPVCARRLAGSHIARATGRLLTRAAEAASYRRAQGSTCGRTCAAGIALCLRAAMPEHASSMTTPTLRA